MNTLRTLPPITVKQARWADEARRVDAWLGWMCLAVAPVIVYQLLERI